MADDDATDGATRRRYLVGAGAVVTGILAGCSGGDAGSDAPGATQTGEPTATDTATGTATASTEDHTDSYSVSMAPVGEITFDAVPERWVPYCGGYADMGVALGQAQGMAGIGGYDRYYTRFYDELPSVDLPVQTLRDNGLNEADMDKELFYAIDADVHVIDPQMLVNWFDWSDSDVHEIRENVAPFLGNLIFRREDDWHQDYRYYTLYEAFEKLADLFQERERYEAFRDLHDEFVSDLQERLPPESERPEVFLTFEGTDQPETFSPYRLDDRGTSKKQWRDLGARDALAGTDVAGLSSTDRGELDYEALLELDPEVILIRGHREDSVAEFRENVLGYMENHQVGRELQAVENGRVYRGGLLHQGPIQNLFLTERAAKQLYPDEFGDVTSDTELFDRARVDDVVSGAV